jgi:hypothetical protein
MKNDGIVSFDVGIENKAKLKEKAKAKGFSSLSKFCKPAIMKLVEEDATTQ